MLKAKPIDIICKWAYFVDKTFTNGKGRGYNVQNLLKKNGIDFEHFAFTPKEEILIEYGQAIAEDPKHVPEELFEKLKANFTEEEIVVITAMGVMMIANNYFNDILDVTPDKLV